MVPINYQSTLERFGFDSELFHEMAVVIQNDASRRLAELERAVAEGNLSAAAVATQALREIATAFDARRAAEIAASIESRVLLSQKLPDRLEIQHVRSAFEEVAAALHRYSTFPSAQRPGVNSLSMPWPRGSETNAG